MSIFVIDTSNQLWKSEFQKKKIYILDEIVFRPNEKEVGGERPLKLEVEGETYKKEVIERGSKL